MEHKAFVIQVLEKSRGDDLERAMYAFRGMTPAQMNEQYGHSGQTRKQVLADYEARDRRLKEAIAWVRSK